jgi:hypothetical protein
MSGAAADPYAVLGVPQDISDAELRHAYRELVKQHHPDHNGGSAESAARFARIQEAYAMISRRRGPVATGAAAKPESAGGDPELEQRIREMEGEISALRAEQARQRRERATQEAAARQRAAREAAADVKRRPTREELGYYSTDDSLSKIVDEAAEQLAQRLRSAESNLRSSEGKRKFARRLADLFSDEK